MNRFGKQPRGLRANKIEQTKYQTLIFLSWLGLSAFLGWLLLFIVQPLGLVKTMYSDFEGYVQSYDLLCMVMIVVFLLFPFSLKILFCIE